MNRRSFFSRLTGVTALCLTGKLPFKRQYPRPYNPEDLRRAALTWRCNVEMQLNKTLADHINRDIRNLMYARMQNTRLRP